MKFWWRERERGRQTQTDRQRQRGIHREIGAWGGWTALEVRDTRALWKHDMQKQVI